MKRLFVTLGLASMLALNVFPQPHPAQAASCPASNPCVTIVGGDIVVVVLGREVARVPAPIKTIQVPVPGPTRTVIVPGPVKTVKVPVPGPTRTVIKPGPAVTVYVTPKPAPTPPTGQNPSPSATLSPQPAKTEVKVVHDPGKTVTITRTRAAGISLGLIALGALLGLIAVYLAGRFARRKAKKEELRNLSKLSNDLFPKE